MKDVIKSKEFDIRRERSDSVEKKKRVVYIVKQGFKLLWDEP